jgi:hypothetical protein
VSVAMQAGMSAVLTHPETMAQDRTGGVPGFEPGNGGIKIHLFRRYSDGREEVDVMWAGVRLVESQFAEAGFSPR